MHDALVATTARTDHGDNAVISLPTVVIPVLDKIARGRFVPHARGPIDPERIAAAIASATDMTVRKITLVSYARSSKNDAWTEPETYAVTLADALERRLGFGLSIKLGGDRWKQLREACGYEEPIRLVDYLAQEAVRVPKRNVQAAVFAVSGFLMAKEDDMADRLSPVLRSMPAAIPLGELRAEPGTWLVLVP